MAFVLGLVGAGISASLTPALHEREGREQGLSLAYGLVDAEVEGFGVEDLPELLEWATRLGYDGLNVTHPFKQAIVPMLDVVSEDAADLGAVNTVVIRNGRLLGHNTDWSGWGRAFRQAFPDRDGGRAVVLGAGGAGAAVGYALLDQGAELVSVHDLDAHRAQDCVTRLAKRYGDERVRVVHDLASALSDATGLVNATPVGMLGHDGVPLPEDLLRADLWVADVVYFPLRTRLLELAAERGAAVLGGGGMAVFQAVGAFECFTGVAPDAARMSAHFEELTA